MKNKRINGKRIKEYKDPRRYSFLEYIYLIVYFVVAGNLFNDKSMHLSGVMYIFNYLIAISPLIYLGFKSHQDNLIEKHSYYTQLNKISHKTLYEEGLIIHYNMDNYFNFSKEAVKKYIEDIYAYHLEEGLKHAKKSFLETGTIDSICSLKLFRDEIDLNWDKYDGTEVTFKCYYAAYPPYYVSYLPPICKNFGVHSSFYEPSTDILFEDRYYSSSYVNIYFKNKNLCQELDKQLYDNIKTYENDGVTSKTIYRLPVRLTIKGNLRKDENNRFYLDNAQRVG